MSFAKVIDHISVTFLGQRVFEEPPPKPGEQRYAVAIQDGSDLWLTPWVRCSQAGDIFVMLPRQDPDFDVHTSYHRNGKSHTKTLLPSRGYLDKPIHSTKRQPLTAGFKGIEHLVNFSGHGKGTGAVCDPKAFDGVVYVEPNILAPHGGSVAVDLVEPGYKLKLEPRLRVPCREPLPLPLKMPPY
jgi:hypothetical protein